MGTLLVVFGSIVLLITYGAHFCTYPVVTMLPVAYGASYMHHMASRIWHTPLSPACQPFFLHQSLPVEAEKKDAVWVQDSEGDTISQ